jgi:hypothetical protein
LTSQPALESARKYVAVSRMVGSTTPAPVGWNSGALDLEGLAEAELDGLGPFLRRSRFDLALLLGDEGFEPLQTGDVGRRDRRRRFCGQLALDRISQPHQVFAASGNPRDGGRQLATAQRLLAHDGEAHALGPTHDSARDRTETSAPGLNLDDDHVLPPRLWRARPISEPKGT